MQGVAASQEVPGLYPAWVLSALELVGLGSCVHLCLRVCECVCESICMSVCMWMHMSVSVCV